MPIVFAQKNNKTLAETLKHRRYNQLIMVAEDSYFDYLNRRLGDFFLALKNQGDSFYKQFLNKNGDRVYCKYFLDSPKIADKFDIGDVFRDINRKGSNKVE